MKKIICALCITFMVITACKHDPVEPEKAAAVVPPPAAGGPPPSNNQVCFNTQVLPLFKSNCAMSGCHDPISRKEGYDLTTYAGIIQGIRPGEPNEGKIMRSLFETEQDEMMPPSGPLPQEQIALIQKWITQGAKNTTCVNECDTTGVTYNTHISAVIGTNCLGCHSAANAQTSGGSINLSSYPLVKDRIMNGSLLCAIDHGAGCSPMPKNSPKLDFCTVRKFKIWAEKGFPQ